MLHLLVAEPPSVGRHIRDVAYQQARGPQEKWYVSIVIVHWISPGDWTSYYCDWFIPSTWLYKDQTFSFIFSQTRVAYLLV